MSLSDLMQLSSEKDSHKQGLSEERISAVIPELRKAFSFWREYPDLFVDFLVSIAPEKQQQSSLKLYFYQRLFLRAVMRHKHAYATFPRA